MKESRLKELFDKDAKVLVSYGNSIINDIQEAEEIVSDSFVRVWMGIIPDNEKTFSILVTNVRQRCIDSIRKRIRYKAMEERLEMIEILEPHEESDIFALAKECIAKMPIARKMVMAAIYFSDMSLKEVSEKLKIKYGTVTIQHKRGLDEIRKYIKTGKTAMEAKHEADRGFDNKVLSNLITRIKNGANCKEVEIEFKMSQATYYKYKKLAFKQ
jgi:RNA polymerase sigma factor (sigma-70 family)